MILCCEKSEISEIRLSKALQNRFIIAGAGMQHMQISGVARGLEYAMPSKVLGRQVQFLLNNGVALVF